MSCRRTQLWLQISRYFERERTRARRMQAMGDVELPAHLDYLGMRTLSTEARQKLSEIRPATLAQAGRIPGITPSDLQNLVIELERGVGARKALAG